jgi:hypothetical protein
MTKTYYDISNFTFERSGYGHYKVTYHYPKSGRRVTRTIDDMTVIDKTRNAEVPKRRDLILLRNLVLGSV